MFAANERLAAWWAALALFTGPVINRPSRHGYLPDIRPLQLLASKPSTTLRSAWTEAQWLSESDSPPPGDAAALHVRNIATGRWVTPSERAALSEQAVVCATPYDPARILRVVVAGADVVAVGPRLSPADAAEVMDLCATLIDRDLFCSLVLQRDEAELAILAVDCFPSPASLLPFWRQIEDGLMRCLTRSLV